MIATGWDYWPSAVFRGYGCIILQCSSCCSYEVFGFHLQNTYNLISLSASTARLLTKWDYGDNSAIYRGYICLHTPLYVTMQLSEESWTCLDNCVQYLCLLKTVPSTKQISLFCCLTVRCYLHKMHWMSGFMMTNKSMTIFPTLTPTAKASQSNAKWTKLKWG